MALDETYLNEFIWLTLTLKSYSDGSSLTVNLSNRDTSSGSIDALPIIKSISGFGSTMGLYTPQSIRGSITLDVSHSSFGYERRFLDLLERYTIQDQAATLKIATDDLSGLTASDHTIVTTGRGWKHDPQSETLRLDFETQGIDRRIVTKTINSDDFPSAPDGSLGRTLPIVFGQDVQVKPYQITQDASPSYAYAATLGTEHPVGGVQTHYAKDHNSEYVQIGTNSNVNTALETIATTNNTEDLVIEDVAIAWAFTSTNGAIITSFDVDLYNNAAGWDGALEVGIWTVTPSGDLPNTLIGQGSIDLDNVTEPTVSTEDTFSAHFEDPVVLEAGREYFISFGIKGNTNTLRVALSLETSSSEKAAYRVDSAITSWRVESSFASNLPVCALYGVRINDTTSAAADDNGFGYASVELLQRSIVGSTAPDLTDIDLILSIDGLKDDSSGTITGTNNLTITRPDHALELISQTWSGSAWTNPTILRDDFTLTTYSSGEITVDGATQGRTSLYRLVEDICRSTQARIALRTDGELQVYANGVAQSSVATITDEDAEVLSIREDPIESTVINDIEMYFSKSLTTLGLESGTADGRLTQYVGRYTTSDSVTQSQTLYGKRVLEKNTFDWLKDVNVAPEVAEIILGKWALPQIYVVLQTPIVKHGDVDLLDVVEILHPDLPAFFGSSYDATLPSYEGDPVQQGGMYFKRAQRYRAQVEARQVVWTPGKPTLLQLTCRLLLNSPHDPT